jgi:biotin/methionine sulfoxide reductase
MGRNATGLAIPVARVADLLLNPGATIRYDGQAITFPDIRLVYWAGGNPFHHHQDLNRLRAAFRRPETVIVNECFWTATARHADIVLPATTALERADIGGTTRDPWILAMHPLVPPVGEARDDYAILAALADRLGAGAAFTEGRTPADWLRLIWESTRQRLAGRGIAAPEFETFWQAGCFRLPEPAGDYVMLAEFRADPVAHALPTPSGRIELGSDLLADLGGAGAPGHPAWRNPEEWLGAPLAARFPLHLLTPQPARRLHGQMDWGAHSRAGKRQGREVVLMHPADAAARGIADGDAVRLFNDRGACHAVAAVEPGIARGVVALPTGSTYDPDGREDRNSNPNVLTRDVGTSDLGQGCAAQSCLVEVARLDGPLPPLRVMAPPVIGQP